MRDEQLLLTKEAAAFLRISVSQLQRLCRRGDGPPFSMVGNRRRFAPSALEAWLEEPENGTQVMRPRAVG